MIRRVGVHTAGALVVMLAASGIAALLLPADAEFVVHASGRTGGRLEGLLLLPVLVVGVAAALALRLHWGRREPAQWPLHLALIYILAFVHLNVLVTGFQRSATGRWDGWIASALVVGVGVVTVLAAVRVLATAEQERKTPPRS